MLWVKISLKFWLLFYLISCFISLFYLNFFLISSNKLCYLTEWEQNDIDGGSLKRICICILFYVLRSTCFDCSETEQRETDSYEMNSQFNLIKWGLFQTNEMTLCRSSGALEAAGCRNNQTNWIGDTHLLDFRYSEWTRTNEMKMKRTITAWNMPQMAERHASRTRIFINEAFCVCVCVYVWQQCTSDASLLTIIPGQWTHSPSHAFTRSVISLSPRPLLLHVSFLHPLFCLCRFRFIILSLLL